MEHVRKDKSAGASGKGISCNDSPLEYNAPQACNAPQGCNAPRGVVASIGVAVALRWFANTLPIALVLLGCSGPRHSAESPSTQKRGGKRTNEGEQHQAALRETQPTNGEASSRREEKTDFEPCGEARCRLFDRPEAALEWLIEARNPKILGFGEAHAPEGFTGTPTVTRFRKQLLPVLAPSSSDLIVELLVPPQGCEQERRAVQRESDAITHGQAQDNQNEYLALGQASKALGVTPDILRPGCEDMAAIAEAGDLGVAVMMETIARLSVVSVAGLPASEEPDRSRVLLYGGALHNDATPIETFDTWSYGPHLQRLSQDRYLEVDLIVPELIRSTDSWKRLPWYEPYASLENPSQPVLIQTDENSFTLVFAPADG